MAWSENSPVTWKQLSLISALVGVLVAPFGVWLGNWIVEVHDRDRARDAYAITYAMHRIDPGSTRQLMRVAADRCLRELLPEERRREAEVPPLLVDAFVNGMSFRVGWRRNHDKAAHEAQATRLLAHDQQRYNRSFPRMNEQQRLDAKAIRLEISGGNDPRDCMYARTARSRWDVLDAPEIGATAFQGAALKP